MTLDKVYQPSGCSLFFYQNSLRLFGDILKKHFFLCTITILDYIMYDKVKINQINRLVSYTIEGNPPSSIIH